MEAPSVKFTTLSGSTYIWNQVASTLVRAEATHELRGDREVVQVVSVFQEPTVGFPAQFLVDLGLEHGELTLRTTSEVTAVFGEE